MSGDVEIWIEGGEVNSGAITQRLASAGVAHLTRGVFVVGILGICERNPTWTNRDSGIHRKDFEGLPVPIDRDVFGQIRSSEGASERGANF